MKKNGYDRPILNTEGGYEDKLRTYDKNPELKNNVANDIPKTHVVAFANGVQSFLFLPLIENYIGENFGPQWKGLELPSGEKLPAYYSYKTMISKIDGYKTAEKVSDVGSSFVYKFTFKNKNLVYVVWDTKDSAVDFRSLMPGQVKVTKVDGTTQNLSSSNISIGVSPIYIEQ